MAMPKLTEDFYRQNKFDRERLFGLYDALGMSAVSDRLHLGTHFEIPWAKIGRGRGEAEKQAIASSREFLGELVPEMLTGNVGLACIFYRPNKQRIDTDNMLKHICDSATGIVWKDDSQVTSIAGITEMDSEIPRTVIIIGEHASSLKRGTDGHYPCEVCGEPIMEAGQYGHKAKTCSYECRQKVRGYVALKTPVPCAVCGEPFVRKTKTARMCSPECRAKSLSNKKKGTGKPYSNCMDCGKQLTHKRGGRCRDCWKINLKEERKP